MRIAKYVAKNLITGLILNDQIKTTLTRAKAIQGRVDRLLGFAKKQTLHGRRQIGKFVTDKKALQKITQDLGTRFSGRQSGFTRIIRLAERSGDGAQVVHLEFVEKKDATQGNKKTQKEVIEGGKNSSEKRPKSKKARKSPNKSSTSRIKTTRKAKS